MMRAMRPLRSIEVIVGAALCVLLLHAPAKAQFYDLDGAYRCLMAPDESCKKGEAALPPAPPPQPIPPSIEEAVSHVRAQQASAEDIALIEKEAAAKEPRAVEALAWCKLNGIGMAADPLEAYRLYGEAAQLGVATAQSNQNAIFQTLLTPEQRQSLLMREQTQ